MNSVDRVLFLGVDGGGTKCRARLADPIGRTLGEGVSGPANLRFGVEKSFSAVLDATRGALAQAGRTLEGSVITACVALAGASEPNLLAAARQLHHPFQRALFTTDAHAACAGAHGGQDGAVIIVGTGTIGLAVLNGSHHRVGGWGFPVSDEGSGAWLGCEVARQALWARDGRRSWTGLLRETYERFGSDGHAIVRWMGEARPGDFAKLAPLIVRHAGTSDVAASDLMRLAASHIDAMAARLAAFGATRLALAGGLAPTVEAWLSDETKRMLVPPMGDPLAGALVLAHDGFEPVPLAA